MNFVYPVKNLQATDGCRTAALLGWDRFTSCLDLWSQEWPVRHGCGTAT